MNDTLRLVLTAVLIPISTLLLCCGLLAGGVLPGEFQTDAARVEQLPSISAVAFEDNAPGREVLIEGVVSAANTTVGPGYVAYDRYVRERTNDGESRWVRIEQVHPPFIVDLPDGTVRVVGEYDLRSATETEETGDERFVGLRVDSPVIAAGVISAGPDGNELEADLVSVGTRDDYISGQQFNSGFARVFGWSIVGLAIVIDALIVALWVLRRRPKPGYP